MAERESVKEELCPTCGRASVELELQRCQMCRRLFCHRCGVAGYGREFCGVHCRDMFFFGDGDESEKDY